MKSLEVIAQDTLHRPKCNRKGMRRGMIVTVGEK